jgi:hypothetical protein
MNTDEGFGPLANSILLSVVGAVMSFAVAWFWFSRNAAVEKARVIAIDHEAVKARLASAEAQLARIDQVVVPINTMMQAMLVRELTHPHTPEMDALMVKLGPPNTLTEQENARLLVLLDERSKDMGREASERAAAAIMPVIMKRAQAEQDLIAGADGVKAVSVITVGVRADDGLPLPVAKT